MGFEYDYTDKDGNKHGTVQRGDGHKVDIVINKKPDKKEKYKGPAFLWDDKNKDKNFIKIDRRDVLIKGSDLVSAHEYSHALDFNKNNAYTSQLGQEKYLRKIDKADGFGKIAKEVKKKFKIKNRHDKRPNEMRADYYALTTTPGENNSNRFKKNRNESVRRAHQAMRGNVDELSKFSKEVGNGTISKPMKNLLKGLNKAVDYSQNSTKRDYQTRKDVNDYILNNKSKENK